MRDAELFARLRLTLNRGWIAIPDEPGYGGTGAPGKLLEELIGVDGSNLDLPDAGRWELKFHSGSAPITLFHLEGEPKGHVHKMVRAFGWLDKNGHTSFRHTIWGESARGFYIASEGGRVIIRNSLDSSIDWVYWTHDRLMNAFSAKLRRLVAVQGRRKTIDGRLHVSYDAAHRHWEPTISLLAKAISQGTVAVDFDTRTNDRQGLRNHGTKFRVKVEDLHRLYSHREEFTH